MADDCGGAAELGGSVSHTSKLATAGVLACVKHAGLRRVDPSSIIDYAAWVHLPDRQERRPKPELREVVPA